MCCNEITDIGLEIEAFFPFKNNFPSRKLYAAEAELWKRVSEKEFVLQKFSEQSNYLYDFISTIFTAKNEFCATHQMLVKKYDLCI